MKTYEYKGYRTSGSSVHGFIEALSEKDARRLLVEQNILPEKMWTTETGRSSFFVRKRNMTVAVRGRFYRQCGAMLQAGIPLRDCLVMIMQTPEWGLFKGVLGAVRDAVQEGESFASAVEMHLPDTYLYEKAIIQAGEESGALGDVLHRLADSMEHQDYIRSKMYTALLYPAIVVSLAIVITIVLFGVLLPRFTALFSEAQMSLPLFSTIVFQGGRYFIVGGALLALGLGVVWLMMKQKLQKERRMERMKDALLNRLPVYRQIYRRVVIVRFSRTFALLSTAGLDVIQSLKIAGHATGSYQVESSLESQLDHVRHGGSLADALRATAVLSDGIPGWVQAGEANGNVAGMLDRAADSIQEETMRLMDRSVQLLESALIIGVGMLVLIVAMAVMLPLVSLNQAF